MRAVHRNLFILLLLVVLASSKTPDSDLCKTKEKEGDIDYYCDNSPIFVCKDYGKDKYCVHKGVFPAEWRELLGALILAVAISLCNAAGIGGGGIIVTINVTLFQFSAKESIAMSNFVIFFGCLTRYIRNFKNKHPLKDATAIDYGIVTCQMPLVMLGTFIGVQINEILPETLVFILLFVTLLYLTYKAFMKAIDAYKKEKKIAQEKKEQKDEERVPLRDATRNINGTKENVGSREDMFQPLMQHNDKANQYIDKLSQTHDNGSGPLDIKLNPLRQSVRENSRQSIARGERIENDTQGIENEDKELLIGERRSTYKLDELNSKLKMYLKLEKSHFRIRTILIVLLPFLTITIFALLRGTKTFDSIAGPNFGRCTVSDYIFLAAEIVILFILSGVNIMLLYR